MDSTIGMNNEQLIEKLNNSLQQRKNAYEIDCFQAAKTIAQIEGKELKFTVSIERETASSLTILVEYDTEAGWQGCELIIDTSEFMDWVNDQTKDIGLTLEIIHNPIEIETKTQYIKDFINEYY